MSLFDKIRAREDAAGRFDQGLEHFIKRMQSSFWAEISKILPELSLDENGNIKKSNIGNISKIGKVATRVEVEFANQRVGLFQYIINRTQRLLGYNKSYFREVARPDLKIDSRVSRIVLLNLGYDVVKNKVISGGWLDSLGDNRRLTGDIARDMRNAIQGGVGFGEFQQQFKDRFTGQNGLGYLERHFETFSRDLFMQVDRTTQKLYADNLGLDYYLYSGTLKDNTRSFCKARVQNYYTSDEIEKWRDLNFKGKYLVGYDPFTHCGGYNCRHHLSAVSKELLETIGALNKVNTYN